eukprot:TRINITY_DN15679_c0_g1_i1.p1 TRINITY_DN15679_c0_g1~~TRINITY_DN15679_c0_g1_i1.p1  ORF type:complete len:331 (+),score=82.65 TRINITY_DN15679_c0_g1_i1:54-1046(+)
MKRSLFSASRILLRNPDPAGMAAMLGGMNTIVDDINEMKAISEVQDPCNMGSVLGGDKGIGTDCSHLEGLEAEAIEHTKIGQSLDEIFPAGAPPIPNAMEIATMKTAEEMAVNEGNDIMKEMIREKYRKTVEMREAEKRRVAAVDARIAELTNSKNEATPAPTPTPPVTTTTTSSTDPYDMIEEMGNSITNLMKQTQPSSEPPTKTEPIPEPKKVSPPSPPSIPKNYPSETSSSFDIEVGLYKTQLQLLTEKLALHAHQLETLVTSNVPVEEPENDGDGKKTLRVKLLEKKVREAEGKLRRQEREIHELRMENISLQIQHKADQLRHILS